MTSAKSGGGKTRMSCYATSLQAMSSTMRSPYSISIVWFNAFMHLCVTLSSTISLYASWLIEYQLIWFTSIHHIIYWFYLCFFYSARVAPFSEATAFQDSPDIQYATSYIILLNLTYKLKRNAWLIHPLSLRVKRSPPSRPITGSFWTGLATFFSNMSSGQAKLMATVIGLHGKACCPHNTGWVTFMSNLSCCLVKIIVHLTHCFDPLWKNSIWWKKQKWALTEEMRQYRIKIYTSHLSTMINTMVNTAATIAKVINKQTIFFRAFFWNEQKITQYKKNFDYHKLPIFFL